MCTQIPHNQIDTIASTGIYKQMPRHSLDKDLSYIIVHKSGCKIKCSPSIIEITYNSYCLKYDNTLKCLIIKGKNTVPYSSINDNDDDDDDDDDDEEEDDADDNETTELHFYGLRKYMYVLNETKINIDFTGSKVIVDGMDKLSIELYIIMLCNLHNNAIKFMGIKLPISLNDIDTCISKAFKTADNKSDICVETHKGRKRTKNTVSCVKKFKGDIPEQLKLLHDFCNGHIEHFETVTKLFL